MEVREYCVSFKYPLSKEQVETLVAFLSMATEEQRLYIFNNFCKHCGSCDPKCTCMMDC